VAVLAAAAAKVAAEEVLAALVVEVEEEAVVTVSTLRLVGQEVTAAAVGWAVPGVREVLAELAAPVVPAAVLWHSLRMEESWLADHC
jgi:hypothetical protein